MNTLREINSGFRKTLENMGIPAHPPQPPTTLTLRNSDDEALKATMKTLSETLHLLIVVIPDEDASLYNQIKKAGDIHAGIHTICVVGWKIGKRKGSEFDLQYLANVALKFNLKMGGKNHRVVSSGLELIEENKTMVVGIDVTHPAPGSTVEAPSVASMVASVDSLLSQWPAVLRIQRKPPSGEAQKDPGKRSALEMVQELSDMLKCQLQRWKRNHATFPENILVYRDGVSEGQYALVLDNELPLLQKACVETYPATTTKAGLPKISIIVVGKRHHTRFYPSRVADKDRNDSAQNGTVVDRGITQARNWDFFLQAHAALQGTARPAHYYVIFDQIFPSRKLKAGYQNAADVVEELTHAMCYQFGRATKAVSICPPAYYADKACDRARRYLSHVYDPLTASPMATGGGDLTSMRQDIEVHERLRDSMFYI